MTHNADNGWQERALDLAERCEAMAEELWSPTTQTKLRQTASSLRWQVRWEQKHPSHIGRSEP